MFMSSPLLNREVTAVAKDLLQNYKLGSHEGTTDVLNIGYSLTPYPYGRAADKRAGDHGRLREARPRPRRALLRHRQKHRTRRRQSSVLSRPTPPRPQRRRDEGGMEDTLRRGIFRHVRRCRCSTSILWRSTATATTSPPITTGIYISTTNCSRAGAKHRGSTRRGKRSSLPA